MTDGDADFLRRLIAGKPPSKRLNALTERFAKSEGIGRVKGAAVVYEPADFVRAANILVTRGFDLEASPTGQRRAEAGRGGSEKARAAAVGHELVAVVPIHMELKLPAQVQFLAMSWQNALAQMHEQLLVCDNLEPMGYLHAFGWLERYIEGRPTLAVYRGGPTVFGTKAPTDLIAAGTCPTFALHDFDLEGLQRAAILPRRKAICLPDWKDLEAAVLQYNRRHLFTGQLHKLGPALDKVLDPEIAALWKRMKSLTAGLNLENFPRRSY